VTQSDIETTTITSKEKLIMNKNKIFL